MILIKKLAKAKAEIKATKLKKEGRNTYSNYDYFTPSQIEHLVQTVCESNGLLTKFDLERNQLGVTGKLTVYNIDNDETICFEMATAIPEIKATNIAQQLGGCVTYTERYLKMSAFGITDSNLDFDASKVEPAKQTKQQEKPYFTAQLFERAKLAGATIEAIEKKYTLTADMKQQYLDYAKN